MINDPAFTDRMSRTLKTAFGNYVVLELEPGTTVEDYAVVVNSGAPKALDFIIEVYDPAGVVAAAAGGAPLPINHPSHFAPVPEPTIRSGVEAMTLAVPSALGPASTPGR